MTLRRNLGLPLLLGALHLYVGIRILPSLPGAFPVRLGGLLLLVLSYGLMSFTLAARSLWPRALADRMAAPGFFMAGLVGARRRARIVNVDVPLQNLPPALHGFSIVQISDIHVGTTIHARYVERIVKAVNALKPDLIAVTGDMVDGSVRELASHTAPLAELRALHGAFFVTGNHEYYSGASAWTTEFKRLGLRVLLNEHVVIKHQGAPVVIAGVTDFSSHHFNPSQRSDPKVALAGAPADATVKILLAHQPRSAWSFLQEIRPFGETW